jgi:lysophospholipase L1-like esterase
MAFRAGRSKPWGYAPEEGVAQSNEAATRWGEATTAHRWAEPPSECLRDQTSVNKYLATILTPPLLPILLAQGYWVRKRTPRLPGAEGPHTGTVVGAGEPLKLIAVGESTVAGIGARTHEEALTGQLARNLSEQSGRTVTWKVVARSGINARATLTDLVPQLAGWRADVVLIALGVNDSIEFHTSRRWAADLERLIAAVRGEVGDALVILAGVPPLDYFPALPSPLSLALGARSAFLGEASVELVTRLKGVLYVPFQIEGRGRTDLFCADGFHPSELGYKEWAGQLASAFAEFMNEH